LINGRQKVKHPHFSTASAIRTCQTARETLFGDIAIHLSTHPTVTDNSDFCRTHKKLICSIQTSYSPIVITASTILRGLPFKLMFPRHFVLRSINFQRLLFHHSDSTALRPFLDHWFADPARLL
jgi:hypothetical protein